MILTDREVWLSALTWTGFLGIIAGIWLAAFRRRFKPLIAGLAAVALAWLVPPATHRIDQPAPLLDDFAPQYQFHEIHRLYIAAPQDRVYKAMKEVTAQEIHFFQLLTTLRRFGRSAPESILNAPDHQPILEVALRSGFRLLAEAQGCEIVFASIVIPPDTRAAMNFLVEPAGRNSTLLTTETRVYAPRPAARRRFAAYWRTIYPGSALIRYYWLRAIERRALGT
jgi:hypothetical protein